MLKDHEASFTNPFTLSFSYIAWLWHHRFDSKTWRDCYRLGYREPRFQVPAIPLKVVYPHEGYANMIYIDSHQHGEDDPMMRCVWDFNDALPAHWRGVYQICYTDSEMDKYVLVEDF